jgi:hypothetical protein
MAELYIETDDHSTQKFVVMMDMDEETEAINGDMWPDFIDVQISDIGIMLEALKGGHQFQAKAEERIIGSLSATWKDVYDFLETRQMMEDSGL